MENRQNERIDLLLQAGIYEYLKSENVSVASLNFRDCFCESLSSISAEASSVSMMKRDATVLDDESATLDDRDPHMPVTVSLYQTSLSHNLYIYIGV